MSSGPYSRCGRGVEGWDGQIAFWRRIKGYGRDVKKRMTFEV